MMKRNRYRAQVLLMLFTGIALLLFLANCYAQPANDNCTNAALIAVPASGYGLGTFTSAQINLTQATIQTGETFAPAIFVAGLDKKSVWFKFSISSIRAVRVTLTQPGTTITAGDAGFAVYQSNNCLPGNADISNKLTPIITFGNTYNPCVASGDYLIQVSANLNANGPIVVQLEVTDQTGAAYDHPSQAYAFGEIGYYARKIDFNTECQSVEDGTELCSVFSNPGNFNKSAWLTFKTPAYFDYIAFQLSGTGQSYYFPSNNNQNIYRTFGYRLYKGNVVSSGIAGLMPLGSCDSLQSNGYYAGYRMYHCNELDTGTVYSIQIFIRKDFADDIRIGLLTGGQAPTNAPKPILSSVPSPNAIGPLPFSPAGVVTNVRDVWGCNSRHNTSVCNPALPDTGIDYNGGRYSLSSFFTFSLTSTCGIYFDAYVTQCGPMPLVRVYKQSLNNNCSSLDTANIVGRFIRNGFIDCLAPGNYVVQVSGQDYTYPRDYFNQNTPSANYEQCLSANLGTQFNLGLTAYYRKASNKYSLRATGAFDSINRVGAIMQPLQHMVAASSLSDTMGCANTVRSSDTTCSPVNNKVMYRQFVANDSGVVDFSNLTYVGNTAWRYRLYAGDANALATAQNLFAYPDKITGLAAKTECFDGYTSCSNRTACVVPGTYTFTTMGGDGDVGRADQPVFTFVRTRTKHSTPFTAQNMGSIIDTLGPSGGTITSDTDTWGCDDNAEPINGYVPCTLNGRPATKAIYRQFYLKEPALIRIDYPYYWYCAGKAFGYKTLFYGKATDGLGGLTPVGSGWSCFQYAAGNTVGCDLLPAGWYTVVAYNQGPSYDSTFRHLNLEGRYNSSINYTDEFRVTVTPTCPGPKFNRPYKASVNAVNQPHAIVLQTRAGHTAAFPRTDSTYVLPTESFNCTIDTPFANHPIVSCDATANRVAYYVFKTSQEATVLINASGYYAMLYRADVRTDSALLPSMTPVQNCNNAAGYIQFCHFQPGTYTLVIFAGNASNCQSVTPTITIDVTNQYSRFDYARNAYDFGLVPPDSVYHYGKVGDVNPLNAARNPSNDFFYCTTGANASDPTGGVCGTTLNPNIYGNGPNQPLYDSAFPPSNGIARRNLWYTFVLKEPGNARVTVKNLHDKRGYQPKFAVYKSDVDATLPFSSIVSSGGVDSTTAQGLTFIGSNPLIYYPWWYCYNGDDKVTFYRDPCSSTTTRYYVLVEDANAEPAEAGGNYPNTQIEVGVALDSVSLVLPKHDHYSLAGDFGSVGVGTYQGDVDNFSCATRDATDPIFYYGGYPQCQRTLWYKITPTITGNIRYRIKINGVIKTDHYDVQLFKSNIPGDSTINGLQILYYNNYYAPDGTSWAQHCVAPGTYYLMITGCGQLNEYVYPEIQLVEQEGDFCSRAVTAGVNGPGNVTASVLVNCHTIGTDYGEFGPKLTCPQDANTADYKSSWFRMDVGGTDTLDVTTYLIENTNASSSDIKYRMMTGNCGAMQEQSCVLDALTQNTYQCLVPGQSYYVQVFTPVSKFSQAVTGTIDLVLNAVKHADTCAPLTNCLATANFTSSFNCNTDELVKFVNFSTYGTSIRYKWSFGYNGQTSTDVSPSFFYPALPRDSTYTVKLVVENISCGKKDSVTRTVTVPGRPFVNLGADISQCAGQPVTLRATSHPGAVYTWQNGSSADTLLVTTPGDNTYWVKVDYNGCSNADTIQVMISRVSARPLQQVVLCTDSVSISAARNVGETYRWSNGTTGASIFVSRPGVYWVDVKYFGCTYRDSFVVNNAATAKPLGNDTTLCLSGNGYVLRATSSGAVSYRWQNASTADTLRITSPGEYSVAINFGSCAINDTVNISGFPAPQNWRLDTTICTGASLVLPWGATVSAAGTYRDTVRFAGGCDSLIRVATVRLFAKPFIGNDTTVCLAAPFVLNATTSAAVGYSWQDGQTGATYNVTAPGLYWVAVNFGACTSRDSIVITSFGSPLVTTTDTSICAGTSLLLPWGVRVSSAGTYSDTIAGYRGCDSVIRNVRLTIATRPSLGNDTAVRICSQQFFNLDNAYNTTGFTSTWTLNAVPVANPAAVNSAGSYQLVARNSAGCSDTAVLTLTVSPKPVLGNDSSVAICTGQVFNLTSVYSTSGLSSNWTINGTAVANAASVNTAGDYQLIASGTGGCADTAHVILSINAKPNVGNDTVVAICTGAVVNLTVLYNTGTLSTTWTNNGSAVTNPTAVTAAGLYGLVVTNAAGCTDTALVTINLNARPSLGIDTTIARCAGTSLDLTSLYNTTTLTSNWSYNNVPVSNAAAVTAVGNYQLIAANANGCADTAIVQLTLAIAPVLGNDTSISFCQGASVNLINFYTSPNYSNAWYLNTIAVANPAAVNVAGVYAVVATNAVGCKDTAQLTLQQNAKPALGNDTIVSVCPGTTVNLTSLYVTNGFTTTWTNNNAAVPNPSQVSTPGLYRLIVTNTAGCTDTAFVTININALPILGNDTTVARCAGTSLNLTSLYNTTTLTSNWFYNNVPVTNAAAVTAVGNYQLIATNANGCADTAIVQLTVAPAPGLGNDTAIRFCQGASVNLTAYYTSPNYSNAWYLNTVSVADPAAVNVAGIYTVVATNAAGCKDTAQLTLQQNAKPALGNDTSVSVCPGTTVNLTSLYVTTGFRVAWTNNNVAVPNPSQVNAAGVYRLIVSNPAGCTDTALVRIIILPKPALGNDSSINICQGAFINLNSLYNVNGGNSSWTNNATPVTNPAAVAMAGVYQLIVVNAAGCSDTAKVTLTVSPIPTVVVNVPAPVCIGVTVDLTAAAITAGSSTGLSFTYWLNVGNSQAYATPSTAAPGMYYIRGTDNNGCFAVQPIIIRSYPLPLVNAGTDLIICDGDSASLTAIVSNTTAPVTYQWQPVAAGGIRNPNAAATIVRPAATQQYTLSVIDGYGCNYQVNDTVLVTVQPPVQAFAGNDTSAFRGTPIQLKASGGIRYTWSPSTYLNNAFVQDPRATIPIDSMQYRVEVKDNAGCTGYDDVIIRVFDAITYYVPNAFTPNNDSRNNVFRPIPIGITNTEYFRIYNRYGQLVFASGQPLKGWDGTYKGIAQPMGNYVWVLKGQGVNGRVVEMRGNVLLIR